MKKSLLTLSMLALGATSVFAAGPTDISTYEKVGDIEISNVWLYSRAQQGETFQNLMNVDESPTRVALTKDGARTAITYNGVAYISNSKAIAVPGTDPVVMQAALHRFSLADGTRMDDLPLTLDGQPYSGTLCANNIGVDQFGHVWIAPFTTGADVKIYQVNVETGALTLLTTLNKGDIVERVDYLDIIGDITREQAKCVVMGSSNMATLYRWEAEQGSTFKGGFDGDSYLAITSYYPETQTQFGTAPAVRMILGETDEDRYNGDLFYVDGFNTFPAIYDLTGAVVDHVGHGPTDIVPWSAGCNGASEFKLKDGDVTRNFVAYPVAQYTGPNEKLGYVDACQIKVVELGEGMVFEGAKLYWTIPSDANGLGAMSDGGTRIHSIHSIATKDANGKDQVTLFTYKAFNGFGVYNIKSTKKSAVESIDANKTVASVVYTNVQGVTSAQPFDGVNIVVTKYTDGSQSTAKVVK